MQFKQFLTEVSLAHAQAKRLGLEYFGFGRYGTKGTVTHHAVRGRLEKLPTKYSKDKGENVLLHYEHLEDAMFNKGAEGAHHAIDILHSLHKEPGNVATQTKIDGCLHEDTIVMTNKGERKIIDTADTDKVLGHDFNDGLDKMTDIANTSQKDGSKKWIDVFFDNGSSLRLTEDHEVYTTNRGWVEAKELTPDDDVKIV